MIIVKNMNHGEWENQKTYGDYYKEKQLRVGTLLVGEVGYYKHTKRLRIKACLGSRGLSSTDSTVSEHFPDDSELFVLLQNQFDKINKRIFNYEKEAV